MAGRFWLAVHQGEGEPVKGTPEFSHPYIFDAFNPRPQLLEAQTGGFECLRAIELVTR
jgi:hypothetical protein